MKKLNTSTHAVMGAQTAKEAYEASVIVRAIERAGSNPQLKGHIHEVLVKDARNIHNMLSMNGAQTELTKSTTAEVVDIITTKGGKVIERIQVKDVTSKSGIDKLVKQCAEGKYRSAKLVGSDETAELFNKAAEKAGISKRMHSSGFSSKTTEAMAQKAGATGSGTLGGAVAQAAKTGGVAGAAIGAGLEAISAGRDWIDGSIDGKEATCRVAKAGAKGGITGAASSAAATATGALVAEAATIIGLTGTAATAATVAAPVVAAMAVGYGVSCLFDELFD